MLRDWGQEKRYHHALKGFKGGHRNLKEHAKKPDALDEDVTSLAADRKGTLP